MKNLDRLRVVGLMSGTSLDGLDVACCAFKKKNSKWSYRLEKAETIAYPSSWQKKLSTAHTLKGEDLVALDIDYGRFLGRATMKFINQHRINPDFISSHGHTIFHQPGKGFTYQLGNGNALHLISGLPIVHDFRTLDVLLGGQGAPLVPVGDKFLFSGYDVCLNLGGIANLSMEVKRKRVAYDICFCNMALNYLAAKAGKQMDRHGNMASDGAINQPLLSQLTRLYTAIKKKRPSLGREIFEKDIQPLLDNDNISIHDRLCTVVESVSLEITGTILSEKKRASILCTGGGAFNSYLVSRMLEHAGDKVSLIIPDDEVVKYKEALVFAFLGVLRVNGEVNCLKSVTGASHDSSAGVLTGFKI